MCEYQKRRTQQRARLSQLSFLLICFFLLSACSGLSHRSTEPLALISAIDTQLIHEGQLEVRAFRAWITLMQDYKGDARAYSQECLNDQQALARARTDSVYRATLQVLSQHVNGIKLHVLQT